MKSRRTGRNVYSDVYEAATIDAPYVFRQDSRERREMESRSRFCDFCGFSSASELVFAARLNLLYVYIYFVSVYIRIMMAEFKLDIYAVTLQCILFSYIFLARNVGQTI